MDHGAPCVKKMLCKKIRVPIQQAFAETLTQTAYATFKAWFDTTGAANREWMKITEDTKPFPGVPQHYWGLMSDGGELPYFSANYADAFFGVNAGPASGGGGRTAAPAAATAPGAAATPASAFPAVDPATQFLGMDLAVAAAFSGPRQALVGRMQAAWPAGLVARRRGGAVTPDLPPSGMPVFLPKGGKTRERASRLAGMYPPTHVPTGGSPQAPGRPACQELQGAAKEPGEGRGEARCARQALRDGGTVGTAVAERDVSAVPRRSLHARARTHKKKVRCALPTQVRMYVKCCEE